MSHEKKLDEWLRRASEELEPLPRGFADRLEESIDASEQAVGERSAAFRSRGRRLVSGVVVIVTALALGGFAWRGGWRDGIDGSTASDGGPRPTAAGQLADESPSTDAAGDSHPVEVQLANSGGGIVVPVETRSPEVTLFVVYPSVSATPVAGGETH